jgi:hypothetical protein
MVRAVVAAVSVLVILTGCGSSPDEPGEPASPTASPRSSTSPSGGSSEQSGTGYFTNAESGAINAVARAAQAAATRATAAASETRCNKLASKTYPAWRACWHGLLDPYAQRLRAVGRELGILQSGSFPSGCVTALKSAQAVFQSYARRVAGLLAGIDSAKRGAQVRALDRYTATIKAIEGGYQKPFTSVTDACYSPQQLEKLRTSQSPSPTS